MLSPQALIKGIVSRALPSLNSDNTNSDVAFRQASYGELFSQPLVRKAHNLADEGSYFVTNTGQSAYNRPVGTSYSATAPWVLIQNQTAAQRLYLDYIAITAVTASTAASGAAYTALSISIDPVLRFSANGTNLTGNLVSPCGATPSPLNNGIVVYGPGSSALTATAASALARQVVGLRILRPAASGTALSVVGDMHLLNFGGVEGVAGSITVANANIIPMNLPPVSIGPGQSALVSTWCSATTPAAGTDAIEIGGWLR